MRHLFTVHTSLADFELGKNALDSYLEIIVRGKARAEKLKEVQLGLDDDATIIYTAAMGIKFLCLHGRSEEGKKSLALGVMLGEWLQEHGSDEASSTHQELGNFPNVSNGEYSANNNRLSPKVLATGFCALGISQAHWANLTCEISERAALQVNALSNLRIATSLQPVEHADLETLYAFALALAKNHDVDLAIGVMKNALSSDLVKLVDECSMSEARVDGQPLLYVYNRRQVVKCWHLLALLLSAKQNFSTAITSCEAALELFGLGSKTPDRSQNMFTEDIEFCDRESIIEISMTQLALTEIVDGPEEALNHFRDLLILCGMFFDHSDKAMAKDVAVARVSPPASRNGTMRSIRSSIMGRSGERIRNPSSAKFVAKSSAVGSFESVPGVVQKTPTISVTREDSPNYHGTSHSSHHFHHHGSNKLRKSNSKKSISSTRKSRAASVVDRSSTNGQQSNSDIAAQKDRNHWQASDNSGLKSQNFTADEVGIAISHDIPPLPQRPSTAAPNSSSNSHAPQSNSQNINRPRLLSFPASQPSASTKILPPETLPAPPPFFPDPLQKRRSLTLLTKIWLQVAALYRRAKMPVDASGAISEALGHVSVIEELVALKHSSAESFSTPGWGGVPSVSELWADTFSEQARLHEFLQEREEAEADYENALTHFPDHPGAIVGLSNILLEQYSPTSPNLSFHNSTSPPFSSSSPNPTPLLAPYPSSSCSSKPEHKTAAASPTTKDNANNDNAATDDNNDNDHEDDTTLLPRLSARDRATGLLSSLTRSGAGWDCAEAWFALARAYELRGQVDKAKEALWWVVELEETRPVRGWGCLLW